MSTPKLIKLQAGDAIWATIYEDQDNTKKLDLASDLTTLRIESYPGGLLPYDTDGKPLKIEQGAYHIFASMITTATPNSSSIWTTAVRLQMWFILS